MNKEELKNILKKHKDWINGIDGGEKADLRYANLRGADLESADLRYANLGRADLESADLRYANLGRANLRGANLRGADLESADLRYANLGRANLRGANLRGVKLKSANLGGADIDYSSWPLWCGSLGVKVDKRIAAQLAYHFCRLDCDDPAYIKARNAILDFANQFHRVGGCGRLKIKQEDINE